MIDPLKYYLFLEEKNAVFSYVGQMHHSLITVLVKSMRRNLAYLGLEYRVIKRIFSVVVEALENISRHGLPEKAAALTGQNDVEGIFMLRYEKDHLYVTTGNCIDNSVIPALSQKFRKIVAEQKIRLRELYNKTLRIAAGNIDPAAPESESGTGIGIIDMALKSDQNINYYINPVNDSISFFVLEVKMKIN
ncbi:MAG: hypothetical protein HYY40_13230 [Bacteroidetes bacterium]|nr:hypothetical protein [Bacteroidota bacterium]